MEVRSLIHNSRSAAMPRPACACTNPSIRSSTADVSTGGGDSNEMCACPRSNKYSVASCAAFTLSVLIEAAATPFSSRSISTSGKRSITILRISALKYSPCAGNTINPSTPSCSSFRMVASSFS
ncbi:hypothetical protein D3C74_355070 [compost metagenome]